MASKFAEINGWRCDDKLICIEIWGQGTYEDFIVLDGADNMCMITHSRNEQQVFTDPFMFAEITLRWVNNSADSETVISAIAASQEGDFFLQVILDPSTLNQRVITGIILPDTLTVDLDCKGVAELRAFDGLKTLENYSTHVATDTLATNFWRMLNNLPNYAGFYPTTAQSVFFSPQFLVTGSAAQVFKDCKFERTFDNDYDYLQAVLSDLNMFLVHTNGYWYLIGLTLWTSGSISGTWYKEQSQTALSSTTLNYSTVVSDIEEGGLRRFTRPFKDVVSTYTPSDTKKVLNLSEATSGPTDVLDAFSATGRFIAPNSPVIIQGLAKLIATSGAPTDTRDIRIQVKFGTKYLTDGGTWTTTASWIPLPIDFVSATYYSVGNIYIHVDLAASLVSGYNEFSIRAEYTSDDGGSGNLDVMQLDITLTLPAADTEEETYTTGSARPAYEIPYNFSSGSILGIDGVYSNGLASYVSNQFALGANTGELHKVRATALKTILANAQTIYECFATSFNGPVLFYEILGDDTLPILCSHNLIKQEATLTALVV